MPASQPDLQFDTVEGMTPGRAACTVCATPLVREYHQVNGHAVCETCRSAADAQLTHDGRTSQFLTALFYGIGAAIVGALLYWGFVKVTNIELGLMAIAVGWLVGKAVMNGSKHRGGRRYQMLAVTLTYLSITMSYAALMFGALPTSLTEKSSATALSMGAALYALGSVVLLVLASPFLAGFSNVIGWLIIAIGLYEAWKHTREVPYASSGPLAIAAPPIVASASSASPVAAGSDGGARGDAASNEPHSPPE
jgi:hypothetical protein